MSSDGNKWFSGVSDPEREFSEPLIARSRLDLIHQALDNGKCEVGEEDNLLEALLLPDRHAQAHHIGELYCSAPLPSDVPGLRLPPLLHEELTGHPLFRRKEMAPPQLHDSSVPGKRHPPGCRRRHPLAFLAMAASKLGQDRPARSPEARRNRHLAGRNREPLRDYRALRPGRETHWNNSRRFNSPPA